MTKKDYIIIAKVIRNSMYELDDVAQHLDHPINKALVFETIISKMSQELVLDNPKFSYHKFLEFINNQLYTSIFIFCLVISGY